MIGTVREPGIGAYLLPSDICRNGVQPGRGFIDVGGHVQEVTYYGEEWFPPGTVVVTENMVGYASGGNEEVIIAANATRKRI